MKQLKGSLAHKIAGVLSAVPTQYDGEDSLDDEARLVDFDEFNEEDAALLSGFKSHNVDLLADDPRYAGVNASRKFMKENSSDDSDEEANSEDSDASEESKAESSCPDSQQESSENEDFSDELQGSINESGDEAFKHMSETNISQQVRKGTCVRNQLSTWESLLEMRIQMQKCLMAANKMPQKSSYQEMANDDNGEFRKKVRETTDGLVNLLDKFLDLQALVVKSYPDTKNLGKKGSKTQKFAENESDEEIPSEDEVEEGDAEESEEEENQPRKKRKLNEYENDLSDFFTNYTDYRNRTIENWNAKTRISITKNVGQPHSVVDQIEHILRDREKLRKKSQLKKTEYEILGQENEPPVMLESNEDNGDTKQQIEEYNTEIFDDTDFYHQLLRELIECKSADMTDPVQLGRQWIQLQALRSKMKRKIDTRATKGRKIRYAVHSKLVNFMASVQSHSWTEDATNELYNSTFGKIKKQI